MGRDCRGVVGRHHQDDNVVDFSVFLDLLPHIRRAERLFRREQPSNLEYEIIRQKEINREAELLLGMTVAE